MLTEDSSHAAFLSTLPTHPLLTTATLKLTLSVPSHLHVLVLVPQVQETMIRSNGLSKLAYVNTHGDEVLPDLPALKVTPQSLLQRAESLLPVNAIT